MSCTVICRTAGTVSDGLSRLVATRMLPSIGKCLPTGSLTITRPSSNSCISATEAIGLVIEAMLKIVSFAIGAPASLSRQPIAS